MRNSECFTLTYLASLLPKAINMMKYTGQEVCSKMYHSSHHCDLKLQFSRAGEGLITLSHEPSCKAVADLRWKLLKGDLIQMKRMIFPIKRHCSISPNIINISCQIRMHFPGTFSSHQVLLCEDQRRRTSLRSSSSSPDCSFCSSPHWRDLLSCLWKEAGTQNRKEKTTTFISELKLLMAKSEWLQTNSDPRGEFLA